MLIVCNKAKECYGESCTLYINYFFLKYYVKTQKYYNLSKDNMAILAKYKLGNQTFYFKFPSIIWLEPTGIEAIEAIYFDIGKWETNMKWKPM